MNCKLYIIMYSILTKSEHIILHVFNKQGLKCFLDNPTFRDASVLHYLQRKIRSVLSTPEDLQKLLSALSHRQKVTAWFVKPHRKEGSLKCLRRASYVPGLSTLGILHDFTRYYRRVRDRCRCRLSSKQFVSNFGVGSLAKRQLVYKVVESGRLAFLILMLMSGTRGKQELQRRFVKGICLIQKEYE